MLISCCAGGCQPRCDHWFTGESCLIDHWVRLDPDPACGAWDDRIPSHKVWILFPPLGLSQASRGAVIHLGSVTLDEDDWTQTSCQLPGTYSRKLSHQNRGPLQCQRDPTSACREKMPLLLKSCAVSEENDWGALYLWSRDGEWDLGCLGSSSDDTNVLVPEGSMAELEPWDSTGCRPLLIFDPALGITQACRDAGAEARQRSHLWDSGASSPSVDCAFSHDTRWGNSIFAPGNWHHGATCHQNPKDKRTPSASKSSPPWYQPDLFILKCAPSCKKLC